MSFKDGKQLGRGSVSTHVPTIVECSPGRANVTDRSSRERTWNGEDIAATHVMKKEVKEVTAREIVTA